MNNTPNPEDEDIIPIENLEDSGLTAYVYEGLEDQETPPDNVLIAGLGSFDRVSVVGQQEGTGELYFASSSSNIGQIIEDLAQFIHLLQTGEVARD